MCPIGTEHGFSGVIHRFVVTTEHAGTQSLVVKQESAAAVEREVLLRSHCEGLVRPCIPDLFRGVADPGAERGVLVFD